MEQQNNYLADVNNDVKLVKSLDELEKKNSKDEFIVEDDA